MTQADSTTHNRRLAKKRVQWFIEHSTPYQLFCWIDSLVLRNPLLRQAPKRYGQGYDDRSCDNKQTLKQTNYEQFWW